MTTPLDKMLVKTPGVCGGRLRVAGTRITVDRIATLYRQGESPEEIARTYPHLTLVQIYTALAYYHAHRDEVDRELAATDAEYDRLRTQQLGEELES